MDARSIEKYDVEAWVEDLSGLYYGYGSGAPSATGKTARNCTSSRGSTGRSTARTRISGRSKRFARNFSNQ